MQPMFRVGRHTMAQARRISQRSGSIGLASHTLPTRQASSLGFTRPTFSSPRVMTRHSRAIKCNSVAAPLCFASRTTANAAFRRSHVSPGVLCGTSSLYNRRAKVSNAETSVPGPLSYKLSIPMRGIQTGPFSGPFSPGGKSVPKSKPQLTNRYIAPPEDGLTRYPTFRSPQGVLRGLDYMGTAVFALSGTVTAGQIGMDVMGCAIVGTITATGGGTVRDLLLGNSPVFWMKETEYLWMCLLTSISVFFAWSYLAEHGVRDDMAVLNWADAMGIGAFCCIGAQAGVRKGLSTIVCVACGMLTSTFGGVIRDVLCDRPPRILFSHAEIYASTAVVGATVYIYSRAAGFSPVGRIASGFLSAVGLRVLAFTTDIRLPSWVQPSASLVENSPSSVPGAETLDLDEPEEGQDAKTA